MISIFTSKNSSVFELLATTLISAIVVFIILFIVGKFFIERFFDWVTTSNSEEIFLGSVFLIVIASSGYLGQEKPFGFLHYFFFGKAILFGWEIGPN